ncbi:MAG: helix-turn-helix domain-containing protein [Sphaerotilus natans subsp. sulfidivorans]|uniref:helix-turn-helix domain-containing protein n=1 Tax=Sphaerotilus sulfidivorans TaxID=639200 RepID=UPI002357385D|nr:helix-turn-helix domain-containing protein [Sphaerotilus sulfidivorans]MCK6401314.1 helix-turn-helix domain-containing protein [Sphaerotilus sulfidivorans]
MEFAHAHNAHPPALRVRHGVLESAWFSDTAACLDLLSLGATALVCIEGDACRGEVIAQAHGGGAFDAIGVVLSGVLRVGETRADFQVQPGEAFLWNSRQSGTFEASDGLRLLQILMPAEQLRIRWPALACGDQPRRPEAPDWAVATAFAGLQALWVCRGQWAQHDLADAAAASLDLLSRPRPMSRMSQAASLAQLVAYIDASVDDPSLGPALLASKLGVSVRTLHALTARHRMTVGDLIRRRRLEGCRAHLLAAGQDSRIADIAAQYGFADPARFSKVFKAEFGVSPREFRRLQSRGHFQKTTSPDCTSHPGETP